MNEPWVNLLSQLELIGNSTEINQIRKSLPLIGKSDQHVMILGDPGTEKMVVAKIVFENSKRTAQTVIVTEASRLNTAYEQEIQTPLKDQAARNNSQKLFGTLVIQNIELMNQTAQDKLYNIAQKSYLTDLNDKKPIETDFRIIATASPKIQNQVKDNQFNSELFLTLTGSIVKLPALNDRKQDIPAFFDYFLNQICKELDRPVPPVNFEIFNQMIKYDWQGNVKELENVVRTLVLASPEGQLLPEALPFFNTKQQFNKLELQSLGMAVSQLEKELIEKALAKFAGNQTRAAQALCISEPNLRFKMKKLGIKKEDFVLGSG